MFDRLNALFGNIGIKQDAQGVIRVSGVNAQSITKDIQKLWTSRINSTMFSFTSKYAFHFPAFFAVEVDYLLREIGEACKTYTSSTTTKRIRKLLREDTWMRALDETHPDILNLANISRMKFTPKPKQKEFLVTYNAMVPRMGLKGYLLAAEPGTGKTFTSLTLAECLDADLVIVVCPKPALYKPWLKDITEQFGSAKDVELVTKEGVPLKTRLAVKAAPWISADGQPFGDHKHYVFHYEAIGRALDLIKEKRGKYQRIVIILDECHNLNEITSVRTQLFLQLARESGCEHTLWMSGTPLKALGKEVVPLLRCIDPQFSRDAEVRFTRIFGQSQDRAREILRHRMGMITFKVSKAEMIKERPTTQQIKVKVKGGEQYTLKAIKKDMLEFIAERLKFYAKDMKRYIARFEECLDKHEATLTSKAQRDEFYRYKQYIKMIRRDFDPATQKEEIAYIRWYERERLRPSLSPIDRKIFDSVQSVVKYVELTVRGEALGRILGKKRQECCSAMVNAYDMGPIIHNAQKKTLVFSSYVETIKAAEKKLAQEGFNPVLVYADTNKDLKYIVEAFDKKPEINPLLATFQSLSTAVPLIMANVIIMINRPFRQFEYEQTVARADRLGQDAPVFIYELVLDTGDEPNISSRTDEIMQWSKEQVEAILGPSNINENEELVQGFVNNDHSLLNRVFRGKQKIK